MVAAAAPDGHTLAFGPTTPIANAPYLVKGVRYNAESFDYICQIFENIFSLSVGPQSKIASAQELFALAREKPGTVTYGSRRPRHRFRICRPKTSPMRSSSNSSTCRSAATGRWCRRCSAGRSTSARSASPRSAATTGSGRSLVFADERHPAYPNVPIAKELGVATSVPPGHNGLYAPKGLPAEVSAALERACANALKHEAVLRAINNTGMTIKYLNSAQFQAQTLADYKSKGELIQRLGLEDGSSYSARCGRSRAATSRGCVFGSAPMQVPAASQ